MIGFTTMLHALVAAALLPSAFGASLRSLAAMEYESIMSAPPPKCIVENGFDFVGNDVGNLPGQAESCCDLCATVNNCEAWSWSNYNSGTCWFKSARGQVVAAPGVKSALFFRGEVPVCLLESDVDFVGNDITSVLSAKPGDCCTICQNTQGCRAFSWNGDKGGTCYLKSKGGQKIYKAGVTSALAYPVGYFDCPIPTNGIDYIGNDIANRPSANAEGCCAICRDVKGCNAYSWTNQSGGTCYLKSAKVNVVAKAGVTSAVLYYNPPATCTFEYGVDYVGNDVSNAPGVVESCCQLCERTNNCGAWSWSNFNGGTCWFKSGKGETKATAGVISAINKY